MLTDCQNRKAQPVRNNDKEVLHFLQHVDENLIYNFVAMCR